MIAMMFFQCPLGGWWSRRSEKEDYVMLESCSVHRLIAKCVCCVDSKMVVCRWSESSSLPPSLNGWVEVGWSVMCVDEENSHCGGPSPPRGSVAAPQWEKSQLYYTKKDREVGFSCAFLRVELSEKIIREVNTSNVANAFMYERRCQP